MRSANEDGGYAACSQPQYEQSRGMDGGGNFL